MSTKEYKQFVSNDNDAEGHTTKVKVPVVRMFGPVLRGKSVESLQNGCVHIHNAFPYLICRPDFAGMDDSFTFFDSRRHHHNHENNNDHHDHSEKENDNNLSRCCIDWNHVGSVKSIIDIVKRDLEWALSTFDANNNGKVNQTKNDNGIQVKVMVKYIRDISVVKGRGFYGYCTGSPCPFLKIRYYNPKYRWKVKAVLESGAICGGVQFRCFEAHIPYTMQLLKDWRVAGFEYVKFDTKIRFRSPLPRYPIKEEKKSKSTRIDYSFYEENVSSDQVWTDECENMCHETSLSDSILSQNMLYEDDNQLSHGLTPTEIEEVDFILSQQSTSSSCK